MKDGSDVTMRRKAKVGIGRETTKKRIEESSAKGKDALYRKLNELLSLTLYGILDWVKPSDIDNDNEMPPTIQILPKVSAPFVENTTHDALTFQASAIYLEITQKGKRAYLVSLQ